MFILASIFISFALAADKPTCSIRSVTRNCEFFKERKDQEVIKLSDGTFYKNPAAKPATEGMTFGGGSSIPPMGTGFFGMGMAMDGSAYREFVEKDLRTQSEVLDALEGAGLSTEFRLAFSQRAAFMDSQPDQKISLPWPPNEKGAQTKEVTGEEVSTLLKKSLGKKYAALEAALKVRREPMEKQMLDAQKIQLEVMQAEEQRKQNENLKTAAKEKRQQRIIELFNYSKEKIESIVTRGKPESQWTDVEKMMVERVRALKVGSFDTAALSPSCADNPSNAFYNQDGTIAFCPGKTTEPDANLIRTIGHEIGHAIDPCNFQYPEWSFDKEKFNKHLHDHPVSNVTEKNASRYLKEMGPTIYSDMSLVISDEDYIQKLQREGVLKKKREGLSFEKYPFKAEYACLVKEGGFRENTKKDIADTMGFLRNAAARSLDPEDAKKTVAAYEKAMKKYPQCLRASGHHSQMGEVMGDMFGYLVQEKYLAENPFKNEAEKVGGLLFAHSVCNWDRTGQEIVSPLVMSKFGFDIVQGEHPESETRAVRIGLTLPGMAEAFECKRPKPGCFDHLSLTARGKQQLKENESASKQRGEQ